MNRFSSVVLVDRRGWVLLQERDEHPAIDPDRWGFCGGHLEPGEDFEPGAYREVEEETGLVLPPGSLAAYGDFTVFHEHTATHDPFRLYVAAVDLDDDDIDCREGRRIVFVEPGAAQRLELTASATSVLPQVLASDAYRRLCR
jgi:8-oxo-dGTP diphosphatase